MIHQTNGVISKPISSRNDDPDGNQRLSITINLPDQYFKLTSRNNVSNLMLFLKTAQLLFEWTKQHY
jgi:hypothetical protein